MHCCKALCLTKCTSRKRRGGLSPPLAQLIDLLTLAIRFLGMPAHATETRLDRGYRDNHL
jgi:hypothetical protein